jgi:hypothetical protein
MIHERTDPAEHPWGRGNHSIGRGIHNAYDFMLLGPRSDSLFQFVAPLWINRLPPIGMIWNQCPCKTTGLGFSNQHSDTIYEIVAIVIGSKHLPSFDPVQTILGLRYHSNIYV